MARTSIATDTFDSGVNTSNWVEGLNNANAGNIQTGNATQFQGQFSPQASFDYAAASWSGAGSFSNDQYSSITGAFDSDLGANYALGVIVRASGTGSADRNYYEAYVDCFGTANQTTVIAKRNGNTRTQLNSTTQSWDNGDRLTLEVSGSSTTELRLYRNADTTPILTATDSTSPFTSGVPGITACSGLFGDNWEGGNYSSASQATRSIHQFRQRS